MTSPDKPAPLLPFRVHFVDGQKPVVQAKDAIDARRKAAAISGAKILKVKLDREV